MGRKKTYTSAKRLKEDIEAYFAGITVRRAVTEFIDTGERTNKGKPILREVPVKDLNGEPIYETVFLKPPTITGLCLFLGISLDTFENYAKDKTLGEVISWARLVIEQYLEEQLSIRDKPQGIIFNLKNNFGYTEKSEVTVGGVEEYIRGLGSEQAF